MWERMAWCESRNTWDVDTGNGYYGGLQFALGSWQWMGGEGNPADATRKSRSIGQICYGKHKAGMDGPNAKRISVGLDGRYRNDPLQLTKSNAYSKVLQ